MNKRKLIATGSCIIGLSAAVYAVWKLTCGLNGRPAAGKVVFPGESQWLPAQRLELDGKEYAVTGIAAFAGKLDGPVGKVSYGGTDLIPASQYQIFAFKGHGERDLVAIKTRCGYLIAKALKDV